jgi:formate dehydrogenase subunit gamma
MPRSPDRLVRFTRAERWIHRTFGLLMGVCLATAALLYFGPLSTLVGRRDLVETVHFFGGLLLPVPLILGALLSPAFRRDVRRLNRFRPGDWAWLRASDRRSGRYPSGKFNAGQKLNSAFTLGAVLALLATGLMLRYFALFPDDIRTGATLVHDALAAAVAVIAAGHVYMALNDPEAMRGLSTGRVSSTWAEREHSLWAAELAATPPRSDPNGPPPTDPGGQPPPAP